MDEYNNKQQWTRSKLKGNCYRKNTAQPTDKTYRFKLAAHDRKFTLADIWPPN